MALLHINFFWGQGSMLKSFINENRTASQARRSDFTSSVFQILAARATACPGEKEIHAPPSSLSGFLEGGDQTRPRPLEAGDGPQAASRSERPPRHCWRTCPNPAPFPLLTGRRRARLGGAPQLSPAAAFSGRQNETRCLAAERPLACEGTAGPSLRLRHSPCLSLQTPQWARQGRATSKPGWTPA